MSLWALHYIWLHINLYPSLAYTGMSVSISTFSLVAIAIERYSAICNPLKSRAWQTRSHAYKVIAATWVLSVGIMVPYPVFSILMPINKPNNITAHMCRLDWPNSQVEQTWLVFWHYYFYLNYDAITWRLIGYNFN